MNTYDLGVPPSAFPAAEMRHGIHAGSYETSVMLATRADLVDMDQAEDFVPISVNMEREYRFPKVSPDSAGKAKTCILPELAAMRATRTRVAAGSASSFTLRT